MVQILLVEQFFKYQTNGVLDMRIIIIYPPHLTCTEVIKTARAETVDSFFLLTITVRTMMMFSGLAFASLNVNHLSNYLTQVAGQLTWRFKHLSFHKHDSKSPCQVQGQFIRIKGKPTLYLEHYHCLSYNNFKYFSANLSYNKCNI